MHRLIDTKRRSSARGFTLIELLVGLAVGMIVLTAVVFSWSVAVRNNAYVLSVTALNNDMRSIMHIVTQDVRRASEQFAAGSDETVFINESANCIAFDANVLDMTEDDDETPIPSGYRLINDRLEMWFEEPDSAQPYINKESRCDTDDRWQSIHVNGDRGVSITSFSVDTDDSFCIELFDFSELESAGSLPTFSVESDRCGVGATNRVEVTVLRIHMEGSIVTGGQTRTFAFADSVRVNTHKLFI